jgi:hypothetical protein
MSGRPGSHHDDLFLTLLVLSIVSVLIAITVLGSKGAIAAKESPEKCEADCDKYSTWCAVLAALGATLLVLGGGVLAARAVGRQNPGFRGRMVPSPYVG